MKRIYLDWNATAPPDPRVLDRMLPYFRGNFGNPSSLHEEGRDARRAIEEARETVAAAIGAEPREIVFCSGATEANNLALAGLAAARPGAVAASAIEHPSVLECAEALRRGGRSVTILPVSRRGVVDPPAVEHALAERPCLVALMAANNETGAVQPIADVATECARAGVPLHVDAVQTLGKVAFDVRHRGITSASFSAHKIGGPKGAGALFIRAESGIERQIHGGGQERGRRAGTENVAAIVGLGAAVELARAELDGRRERLRRVEGRFLDALAAAGVRPVAPCDPGDEHRLPGTLSLRFPGVSGEGMLFALDLLGVSVSLGSACSSGAARPSHVLMAAGVSKHDCLETVRISMGAGTLPEDAEAAAAAIASVVRRSGRG
jgi:cysteine desulfurase